MLTAASANMPVAAIAPLMQPATCAGMYAKASRQGRPPNRASTSETTGLKWPPLTGPNIRIVASRPAAVAAAFSSSARVSIDKHHFNRYMSIDDCRAGADAEDQAPGRRAVLPAGRLPRRRARAGGPHGRGRQGARRPGAPAARRRAAQARRQGLRLRAGAAVRHLPAHPFAPPQEAARGGHRRIRAPRPLGLLLRPWRRTGGAERMAEMNIRDAVRERYAALAGEGCGCSEVFGAALYDDTDVPVRSSLGCGVPTAVADLH